MHSANIYLSLADLLSSLSRMKRGRDTYLILSRTDALKGLCIVQTIHLSLVDLLSSLSWMKRGHDTYLILFKTAALKGLCIVQTFIHPSLIYLCHWAVWNSAKILDCIQNWCFKGLCIVETFIYPLLIYCRHWVGWNVVALLTWFYSKLMLWRVCA